MSHASRSLRVLTVTALLTAAAVAPAPPASAEGVDTTWRASVDSAGAEHSGHSDYPSVSENGRYVAFESMAALVPEDTNGTLDIYRKDLKLDDVVRVSVSDGETQSAGSSYAPSISGNGRYVAFASPADDLVVGDTNGCWDVFVRDLDDGETRAVTQGDADSYSPSISGDGSTVAFHSNAAIVSGDTNGLADIYRDEHRHLPGGGTWWSVALITRADTWSTFGLANGDSFDPVISYDGDLIAFHSNATNLVAGDSNGFTDVFIVDFEDWLLNNVDHPTTLVSADSEGGPSNGNSAYADMSAEGDFVAFESAASDLVYGDTNGQTDAFCRWMGTGGAIGLMSGNASLVPGNGESGSPVISSDGRRTAFRSAATDLTEQTDANGAWDVFVSYNVFDGPDYVSVNDGGTLGNDDSPEDLAAQPRLDIGGGGKIVAFQSSATNLVSDDGNSSRDVFVRQLPTDRTDLVGTNRFLTAIRIAEQAYPEGLDPAGDRMVLIATGRNWPDALGGTALAGAWDAPILLCDTNSIPEDVTDEIVALGADRAIILGGEGAVGPAVEAALVGLLGAGDVDRIGGLDRYETADAIAQATMVKLGTSYDGNAFVATGGNYPDALAAAPLAARFGRPLFLAHPLTGLSAATVSAMSPVNAAIVLGGEGAVSPAVYGDLVADLGPTNVDRIGGDTRYHTAGMIAQRGVDLGLRWNHVAIATGQSFPDALAGGVLAAKQGTVMLLTTPTTLAPATLDSLLGARWGIADVTFLGGTGAVSESVRTAVMNALD